ncbi:MAG: M50 family metallopeptidase [Psychromonas sp.]
MSLQQVMSSFMSTESGYIDRLIEQLFIVGNNLSLFFTLVFILFILQRLVFLSSMRLFGGKAIYVSAWIGTPVHELSHAFFCIVFGHKIQRVLLFRPDKKGTLGYVTHSYSNRNLWHILGNFFIAIAPLLGGLLALYVVTWCFLDNASELLLFLQSAVFDGLDKVRPHSLIDLGKGAIKILERAYINGPIKVFIWAYCCAAISLHLSPSAEDLKGVSGGALLFALLGIVLMLVNQVLNLSWFAQVGDMINMVSMIYLIGIVLALILLLPLMIGQFFILICRLKSC